MINTLVFEDATVEQLAPITTGRIAYAIGCASYRLIDLLTPLAGPTVGLVRPYLQATQQHEFPEVTVELDRGLKWTLVVNARVAPTMGNMRELEALVGLANSDAATATGLLCPAGALAAAIVPTDLFQGSAESWRTVLELLVAQVSLTNKQSATAGNDDVSSMVLFDYPHDVIVQNLAAFKDNLTHRIRVGSYQEKDFGLYLGNDVSFGEHVVFDTSAGPIVIDDKVNVGPFSFLRGPIYIGPNSKISERAAIKDEVAIGHTCKIGGEVESSVIEPFSNKQHHGFLGHSYLGSWINLGAGTCNSDLKNTYGTVNMIYGDRKVSTGAQFIGCVMGDYSKTAINTSIFTGKTIGAGSMVYGYATTNVPPFVNYARILDQIGEVPPAVVTTMQQRMFGRRGREQQAHDIQLIEDMFRLTANERPDDLSTAPIGL